VLPVDFRAWEDAMSAKDSDEYQPPRRPFQTHRHQRNGLGARNHLGQMVCAICGQPYDDTEEAR